MSADYDRLFNSPDSARLSGQGDDRQTPPAGTDFAVPIAAAGIESMPAPVVVGSRPQAVPTAHHNQTEITSQIPLADNRMMRTARNSVPSDSCREQLSVATGESPDPVSATSQHQATPALATLGSHRAIDALAHVGVRSAVKMPPQRGWRYWVYLVTRLNLGLSQDELYEMDLHSRIRRNARDSYQIGVIGLKGGVGKTALTVALGSALSRIRGDRILAVDADPDGGNLADRVGRQSAATVADLLTDGELHRYNDVRAYTSMNNSNLEVLSSQEYSVASREFNEEDWNSATGIASRYYNLVLADCGAGLFQPATRGVLSTVSGLVIVASASIDGARQAAVTIDWLYRNGYQDLLGRSCVVINHVVPGRPSLDVSDLVQQFEKHVPPGRVIVLPWDRHIAAGSEIQLALLGSGFHRKIVELAAALSDDFDRLERR